MTVLINNVGLENGIFYAILIFILLISLRPRRDQELFPLSISQELKGLAILTVVFVHIAYALVDNNLFLSPLSNMSGLGVNLFLLLSGYGLMISSLRRPESIGAFYKHRLFKLYLPFWLVLAVLFFLDIVFLKINYSWTYVAQSFLGFFNHANLYTDVNSPLWYFTLIIFYYLIFPWLLIRKAPWLSAFLIYAVSFFVINLKPGFLDNVIHLQRLHLMAFPLGMLIASALSREAVSSKLLAFLNKIRAKKIPIIYSLLCSFFLAILIYTLIHSGVGERPIIEESVSIISALALLALGFLKRFEIKALYWLGFFSYEIYLLHWPIMYRYDFLFKLLPAWLTLVLYFAFFIFLAYLMQLLLSKKRLKSVNN